MSRIFTPLAAEDANPGQYICLTLWFRAAYANSTTVSQIAIKFIMNIHVSDNLVTFNFNLINTSTYIFKTDKLHCNGSAPSVVGFIKFVTVVTLRQAGEQSGEFSSQRDRYFSQQE